MAAKPTMPELRRFAAWLGLALAADATLTASRDDAKLRTRKPTETVMT